jgi:methionyl-tRNA formyltransferase
LNSSFDVVAVLTRPDAPQGRKRILTPSPVAQVALAHDVPVIYANSIDSGIQAIIDSFQADLGVVVAYGALLPEITLGSLKNGWINLHFSTLPSWRGAAPVQWQLLSGEEIAGSSVFRLVKELDAGDVFDTRTWPILPDETSGELLERLSHLGAEQVLKVCESIQAGTAFASSQSGESTYARKLILEDGHLKLTMESTTVFNHYRGVTPEPGAFVLVGEERLKVLEAHKAEDQSVPPSTIVSLGKRLFLGCASGSLELITVQPSGKKPMPAMDWFRGLRQEVVHVS